VKVLSGTAARIDVHDERGVRHRDRANFRKHTGYTNEIPELVDIGRAKGRIPLAAAINI
jgi:hypothetical protein